MPKQVEVPNGDTLKSLGFRLLQNPTRGAGVWLLSAPFEDSRLTIPIFPDHFCQTVIMENFPRGYRGGYVEKIIRPD